MKNYGNISIEKVYKSQLNVEKVKKKVVKY